VSERASERAKAKQDILLAAIAEFSFHVLITLQRPMHQFDLLGKVFGRQEMERVPKAINPVKPRVVVVDVVKKRVVIKVCSRGVYEDELKIVIEPVGHPQTLERGGHGLLKTVHTSKSEGAHVSDEAETLLLVPRHLALAHVSIA
jgi:hypothetical protein